MPLQTVNESPTEGLNRVFPPHLIRPGQVSDSLNLVPMFGRIKKVGGTTRYNTESANSSPTTWVHRYYSRRADGSETKKVFSYAGDSIYVGNDVAGTLTSVESGFNTGTFPSSEVMQVSGNSILFFFNEGLDVPYTYDGNDGNVWNKSSITQKFVDGVSHLDRLWAFTKSSSTLYFSKTLFPENFDDSTDAGIITIGEEKSEIIEGLIVYGEFLYIFKTKSIWRLQGSTPSTFEVKKVHPFLGLKARRSLINVQSALMFLGNDDELYSFNGTQPGTKNVTVDLDFSVMMNRNKSDKVCGVFHDNMARFSYERAEQGPNYNDDEIIFNSLEANDQGLPKWGQTRGSRISCYSVWNDQGDDNELVTGRSDEGIIMYHNRTKNYDDTAMLIRMKTRDIMFAPNRNALIEEYHLIAEPKGNYSVDFKTYLNGRIGTNSNDPFNLKGETVGLGFISISNQVRMNERIVPDVNYRRGNSVAVQIQDDTLNQDFELYSITIGVRSRERIISQDVGV